MPDARTGKAVDDVDAEFLRSAGGVFHLFDGPLIDAGRIAVAPNIRRHNSLVPLVDDVEHRLPDQMSADRLALQIVLFEQFPFAVAVALVGERLIDLEVIAPAGQFNAVVAEFAGLAGHIIQRQVGPLAGKERHQTGHSGIFLGSSGRRRQTAYFAVLLAAMQAAGVMSFDRVPT